MRNFTIFISYRHEDCGDFAEEFYDLLSERIPSAHIYLDIKDMHPGRWDAQVKDRIKKCTIFVALFGEKWNETKRNGGSSFGMLQELELARKSRRLVLPVLVGRPDRPPCSDKLAKYLDQLKQYKVPKRIPAEARDLDPLLQELDRYSKPVAFVSSTLTVNTTSGTLDGLDYFTNVVALMSQRMHEEGFDTVLKVPTYQYENAQKFDLAQSDLVRKVLKNYLDYRGLIVAPFAVEPLMRALLDAPLTTLAQFPIATIDKAIPCGRLVEHGIPAPLTMENNGPANGGLAGECAVECLDAMEIKAPHALVLLGLEGSEQRAQGFEDKLKATYGNSARVEHIKAEGFTQDAAITCVGRWFAEEKGRCCDILFACNDELALGARAAFEHEERKRKIRIASNNRRYPMIIGFDGISDVTRLIAGKDRWLLNTIDVQLRTQVTQLVEALAKRLRGHWEETRLPPVDGRRHLDTHKQEKHLRTFLSKR